MLKLWPYSVLSKLRRLTNIYYAALFSFNYNNFMASEFASLINFSNCYFVTLVIACPLANRAIRAIRNKLNLVTYLSPQLALVQ